MATDATGEPKIGGRPGLGQATPWLLRRVNRRYRSAVAAQLEDAGLLGLPGPGYFLLMVLASGAGDATQLVEAIGVTKQAVSKVVDALVNEGFVLRKSNESDRRRTDLVLTAKGERTVGVIRSAVRATDDVFIEEVGKAAWNTTVATLATLARGAQGAQGDAQSSERESDPKEA